MFDESKEGDSTAFVLNNTFLPEPEFKSSLKTTPSEKIKFEFTLQTDIQKICSLYPLNKLQLMPDGYSATIDELKNEFIALRKMSEDKIFWDTLDEKQKISIEEYKLSLMKAAQNFLETKFTVANTPIEKPVKKSSKIAWVLFGTFMVLELIPMLWGGFLGVSALLSTIPWLSSITRSVASIALCSIEVFLFYAVMSPLLKDALGLSSQTASTPRVDAYGKQLEVCQKIDTMLSSNNKMDSTEYKKYLRLANLFNGHITHVNEARMTKFQESTFKKGLRTTLSVLSAVVNVGGGYFFALSLLAATATTAALVGTPLGWGIIGFVILGQIALRLAVRSNAMVYMLNPGAEKHDNIREDLVKYQPNTKKHNETLSAKQQNEKTASELKDREYKENIKKNPYTDDYYQASNIPKNTKNLFKPKPDLIKEEKEYSSTTPKREFSSPF